MGTASYRFAFDIGGTFTDLVLADQNGWLAVGKCLTEPGDMHTAVVGGLTRLLERHSFSAHDVKEVISGATTLVTNLIIERRGAPTGLITTAGFRDVLEIGREMRYDVYDLRATFPEPLVPRALRKEAIERIDAAGQVLTSLDFESVRKAAAELAAEGITSIAVSLLHSYRNPIHERQIRDVIAASWPAMFVSLSSDILPEIREYERTIATILNAYVQPFIGRHLIELESALRGIGVDAVLYMMQSNGGIIARDYAERVPLRLLESGPAAGALAASHVAKATEIANVLSFDMGGTTAKACLITRGVPDVTTEFEAARVHRFKKGSGLPVRLPIIDLIEIGAGGGSIAYIDPTGLMKVGPRSAGARPGPACYDRGGTEPTVTDADLVLGYLDPQSFLGGEMTLRRDLAERAISAQVATPLGMTPLEAADGIYRIVCENMAVAAKIHAAEKGKDCRHYALLAFGGAGPVHARALARRLGIARLVVPKNAGVFSALGLLTAPVKLDVVQTYFSSLADLEVETLARIFNGLEKSAVGILTGMKIDERAITIQRSVDVRYVGQGYEVNVPLSARVRDLDSAGVLAAFKGAYDTRFGHHLDDVSAEALSWRLEAIFANDRLNSPNVMGNGASASEARAANHRPVYFSSERAFVETPVFRHYELRAGTSIQGPAIIEQPESTTVIGSGDNCTVDAAGNLVVELATSEGADV